jgi:hypothetical protein
MSTLDRVNPAPLLQPIEDQVSGVRQRIIDVTHIDQWAARIDDVHRFVDSLLSRVDPSTLGPRLDAILDVAIATAPASDSSIIGSLVAGLVDGIGLRARPRSFTAVLGWMTGDDGAVEVRALIESADTALARALATARGPDLRAIAASLDTGYRRMRTAIEVHPPTSLLRARLDPIVAAISPLDTLGVLAPNQDAYLASLDACVTAVHAFSSHGQSELAAASASIRQAFSPLEVTRNRIVALVRVFGVDLMAGDVRALVAPLLAALRPSRILALFGPVIAALRDKVRSILVDGLITPVQAGVDEIKQLIDQLDISIFRTELDQLFEQVKTELEAFRPSNLLGPTLTALEDFKTHLANYDPLAPVKVVMAALRVAIEELSTELRPSVLLHGVTDTYQQILHLAEGLNVRTILDPVLTALTDIEHQLDGGLDGAATALGHLQESLRSVGSGGGQASITATAGGGG